MASKYVEFCFVDAKGVHNKLYGEQDRDQLQKDIELVEKLRPNAPIRLLGRHKDTGKPTRVYRGAKFDWDNTVLTVSITFGDKTLFTYITDKYVDVGTTFCLITPHGLSYGVVAEPCKRKTTKEVDLLCKSLNIGCLKKLQDCIYKEASK